MNWFWDNICLKKADRAGMFAFLSILFVLLLIKWYLVVFYEPQSVVNYTHAFDTMEYVGAEPLGKESTTLPLYAEKKSSRKPQIVKNKTKPHQSKISEPKMLFAFDPNTINKDSLLLLGLSKYAANNILKYREKGGLFKKASDLNRIYGLDENVYNSIQSYIRIKEEVKKQSPIKNSTFQIENRTSKWPNKKPLLALRSIEINRADTTAFKSLRGIGSVYANRIVKFRNSLGGYFTVDQIRDVWGVSDSLFIAIEPYLTIDTSYLVKKNINLLEKEKLIKHPYIDWKKAKAIISYKKMHGHYQSIDDFKNLHGIEEDFVDTLRYYFVAQ